MPASCGPAHLVGACVTLCVALSVASHVQAQIGPGQISGSKWEDLNHDGSRTAGEPGLSGWLIELAHRGGSVFATDTTDHTGAYVFQNPPFGSFEVREILQPAWVQSFPPPPGNWFVDVTPEQPVWPGIDFGNYRFRQCTLEHEWRRGPKMAVTRALSWWPNAQATLDKMRPGDVIAVTILAEDKDWLVQRCKDCGVEVQGVVQRKWGPYSDKVKYLWGLVPDDPGELIQSGNAEGNTVLYRIPLCGWDSDPATQSATIGASVFNDAGLKAEDPPLLGASISFNMKKDCSTIPGWIKVTIVTTDMAPNEDEVVPEPATGTCIPQPPTWSPLTPIRYSEIALKDPTDLCPNYVTLLSVAAGDTDQVELKCVDPNPLCTESTQQLQTADPIQYSWTLVSGGGEFPLGTTGPVVAFRRSRSQQAVVRCTPIKDSGTRANDPQQSTNPKTILKANKPKAFVGIGDGETWYGARIIDLERAAERAKEKYEAEGYEVEHNPSATIRDVESAIKTSCYQALWITGHGANLGGAGAKAQGNIYLRKPPAGNAFNENGFGNTCRFAWGCFQSPFIRELVVLGCNTYDPAWPKRMICGRASSFHYTLVGNIAGQVVQRNPFIWERDEHKPARAHNLSAP